MSILSYISAKKAQLKQAQNARLEKKALENKLKLEQLRAENAKLEAVRKDERALRAEKEKRAKLKREPLTNTIENLKGISEKIKAQGQAKIKKSGNNPFTPGNSLIMQDLKGTGGVLGSKQKRIKGL